MSDPLLWIGALGGIAATAGAWRNEATARWQARAERLRTDRARLESDLHRQRLAEVWQWWHDQPDGPERTRAAGWYYEWTGARNPFRTDQPGAIAPGVGSRDAAEAYDRYIDWLQNRYSPAPAEPSWTHRATGIPH